MPDSMAMAPRSIGAAALRRRPAAGEDPDKRRQILDGARAVFQTMGFDAASMNDICRAAGVSKGTLYVYFENKERLFLALVEESRERQRAELLAALDESLDLAQGLAQFAERFLRLLTEDRVLRAQRIVLGVTERMPDVGASFFEAGPATISRALAAYLARHADAAQLDIPDMQLAAIQFLELAQSTIVRPRLYAYVREAPEEKEIQRVVASAVALFVRGYAK